MARWKCAPLSTTAEPAGAAREAAETVARQSYGRLVAYLAARSRDVAAAEDALAEAFAAALSRWPAGGVPDKPEAWLLAVARRRQVDLGRRRHTAEAAREHLTMIENERGEQGEPHDIPDERLKLMFACAHPAIDASVRAPLILQTVLGLDAATIAQAFLVPAATMSQRLVRGKTRIRETGIPFRVPEKAELPQRLDAVLAAIYAAYAEGWHDAGAGETRRRGLVGEAIWLGRLVAALLPDEPETLGLLALMLYPEARRAARRSADGNYVPLSEQDTSLWDGELIREAESLLQMASSFGPTGRFQLEAAVQSVHCARGLTGRTDFWAIRNLYEALATISPSPVVEINRAVALAETGELAAGISVLDELSADPRMARYQPYWAARADLLARANRPAEAHEAYGRAIELADDRAVKAYLEGRRGRLGH